MNPWLAFGVGAWCGAFALSAAFIWADLRTYKRTGKSWLMGDGE